MVVVQLSLMKNKDYSIDEVMIDEYDDREHYRILNPKTKAKLNHCCYEYTTSDAETELMRSIFDNQF